MRCQRTRSRRPPFTELPEVCGLNQKEFVRRRRQLLRMVGEGGIAILPAAPLKKRNRDVEYKFRQDSDFFYLTGFAEPESVAVLIPGREHGEYLVFCRERDPLRETWDGAMAGPDGVKAVHGAEDAFPIDDIDDILPGLLETCDRVYYTMGNHPDFDQRLIEWVTRLRDKGGTDAHSPQEFVALDHFLHDMRLYKSRSEAAAMRRAAKIAVKAHLRAMQNCRPGKWEYEYRPNFSMSLPVMARTYPISRSLGLAPTPARFTILRTTAGCRMVICCWWTPGVNMNTTLPMSPGPIR